LSEEATLNTSLTDETGRIVMEQSELHFAGLHTQVLSMRNLSAGVYYFHISDGTSAKTVKILRISFLLWVALFYRLSVSN
jgi:hypothetical protein